jgi:hypothetical protein
VADLNHQTRAALTLGASEDRRTSHAAQNIGIATGVPSANSIRSLFQNKFLLDAHTVERSGG